MVPNTPDDHAFLGLSLTRKGPRGHPDSATHQEAFDFDLLQDRDSKYIHCANEDGWFGGGGVPHTSYQLPAIDSSHVELMRISDRDAIIETLSEGKILIPEMTVVPTEVVAEGGGLANIEVRFDTVPTKPNFDDPMAALPTNWQLRFVQNQLFKLSSASPRFKPGSFHTTLMRQAHFRSEKAKKVYFDKCKHVVDAWMDRGQQPLVPSEMAPGIQVVKCKRGDKFSDEYMADRYRSGLWLFSDRASIHQNTIHRKTITHHFLPNFPPPYDTPAKRRIIFEVLRGE